MADLTLDTTFRLVEQALNNHPLTHVSDDPLTGLVPGDEPDLRRRYTKARAYANAFRFFFK